MNTILTEKDILIIEDDLAIAALLNDYLSALSFSITVVNSGAEALENLKNNSYKIAILDYQLPDMNAIELLKETSHMNLNFKTIISSGNDNIEEHLLKQNIKVSAILQKPFSPTLLKQTIDNCLTK